MNCQKASHNVQGKKDAKEHHLREVIKSDCCKYRYCFSFKDAISSLLDKEGDLDDIIAKNLLLIVFFAFTVCTQN